MYIHNWYHSNVSGILLYTRTQVTIYMAHSPCFFSPLADSPCSPFNPLLLTWNPPRCDRIRPPRSEVACKLTSPVQPFPQTLPLQIPEPQLPSASLRRPQEQSGVFCPEQLLLLIVIALSLQVSVFAFFTSLSLWVTYESVIASREVTALFWK